MSISTASKFVLKQHVDGYDAVSVSKLLILVITEFNFSHR